MYRALIISDDKTKASILKKELKNIGYKISLISLNNQNVIKLLNKVKIDILLFDVLSNRVRKSAEMARHINKKFNLPFIILAPLIEIALLKKALKHNLSAYLVKPINIETVISSIEIAIQKSKEDKKLQNIVKIDEDFLYDLATNELLCNNISVNLTKKERELLSLFIENRNKTVSFFDIENRLWPDKVPNDNTRRSLISRLRSKLKYKPIQTIPSIGYRLNTINPN